MREPTTRSAPRLARFVAALALVLATVGVPSPASASGTFLSGACALTLDVTISSNDLDISTVSGSSICQTTGGVLGTATFDASVPGTVGFTCVGGVGQGTGELTVTVDGFTYDFSFLDVAVAAGEAVAIELHGTNGTQVVAGSGAFAQTPTVAECGSATSLTWTGAIEFVDPEVDEPGP